MILKMTAVVTLGVLGVVIPWALALGAAACRIVIDMIGQALRCLWHWVVGVGRATWLGIRRWVGVVIELAVLITGWLLVWMFRFLAEGLIGLIRVGAALWRGPTVVVGAALIAFKEWLQRFLRRTSPRSAA